MDRNYNSDTYAPQNIQAPASLAVGALAVDVLMTAVLITGMVIDKHSVTLSVLSGVTFFLVFGSLVMLTLSGTLTHIITNGQNNRTTRHMYDLQYDAEMEQLRVTVADRPRLAYTPSAPPLQLPDSPTYVSAVPPANEVIKVAAASFITQLFDTSTGRPLPTRITKNKQQIQFKSPESDVVEYMKSLGIVVQEGNHLYYNATHFPTYREAINAVRTGRRPTPIQEGRVEDKEEGYHERE